MVSDNDQWYLQILKMKVNIYSKIPWFFRKLCLKLKAIFFTYRMSYKVENKMYSKWKRDESFFSISHNPSEISNTGRKCAARKMSYLDNQMLKQGKDLLVKIRVKSICAQITEEKKF